MNAVWALSLLLCAIDGTTTPPPPLPTSHLIPDALSKLLATQPALLQHHEGYLKELAARPALARTETAWWQASSVPSLRALAEHFEDALATNESAQLRFDAFYTTLAHSTEAREAVETLVRTELDRARTDPSLPPALRYIRANPDIGLRFLKDTKQVRPLPPELRTAFKAFERQPEWTQSLFIALDKVAHLPDAHVTIFPWWRELDQLDRPEGVPTLDDALEERPNEYWMWHQRNLSLAGEETAGPWMRYWSRLVQRDPELAKEYGPFLTKLLAEPEQLRQHLVTLQEKQGRDTPASWPPKSAPPKLAPRFGGDAIDSMLHSIQKPVIEKPARPTITRPQRPTPPTPPTGSTGSAPELRTYTRSARE